MFLFYIHLSMLSGCYISGLKIYSLIYFNCKVHLLPHYSSLLIYTETVFWEVYSSTWLWTPKKVWFNKPPTKWIINTFPMCHVFNTTSSGYKTGCLDQNEMSFCNIYLSHTQFGGGGCSVGPCWVYWTVLTPAPPPDGDIHEMKTRGQCSPAVECLNHLLVCFLWPSCLSYSLQSGFYYENKYESIGVCYLSVSHLVFSALALLTWSTQRNINIKTYCGTFLQ